MKNFIVSYSCGKDSTLALYRMIQQGYKPSGLLVTINKSMQHSWFHLIPRAVIQEIADSLKIPVYFIESTGSQDYLNTYENTLKYVKSQTNTNICVFGDIDIEEHRSWCTDRTNNVDMEAVFPLWKENREKLVYEFIECGFDAIIKVVDTTFLSPDLLGKQLTKEIIEEIKTTGADPCGENGEYHTITINGPIFENKIELIHSNISSYEQYRILEIKSKKTF